MKHLKTFESFSLNENNEQDMEELVSSKIKSLSDSEIEEVKADLAEICENYNIVNYTINEDGSIDVYDNNVHLNSKELTKLPIRFRSVRGSFDCGNNQLTTLEGSPQSVGGDFYCSNNQLTSLEGSPQSVGGDFYCSNNQLTSLEGSPKSVGGDFYCSNNQLTSLEGSPKSVGGDFYSRDNRLISLEGSPQSVGGRFSCGDNRLISLEGSPQSVGYGFECHGNPIENIWILFRDYSKIELFNEHDVLRVIDGKLHVVLNRLNSFLQDIGKDPVEKVDGWINI